MEVTSNPVCTLACHLPRSPPAGSAFDDDVYPVHLLDDSTIIRSDFPCLLARFNDVLDVNKVQLAIRELLEIGDWKKLGGRLRTQVRDMLSLWYDR